MRFQREGELVVACFTPEADHQGYDDRVHGGVLSAVLDETMVWACCVRTGRFCLAAQLQVRFLRPAPIGASLAVRGEMTADRGRLWEARAEIRDGTDAVIARGAGKYFPLSEEETRAIMGELTAGAEVLGGAPRARSQP
jgi:uncharacterized protein (TIGR00369 family)